MEFEQALAITVPLIGVVGLIVTYLGQKILKSNAELSANISRDNAELSAALAANVKISEFRQDWINSLRDDMAEFQKASMTYHIDKNKLDSILELGARIELRMNPSDRNFLNLKISMVNLRASSNASEALKRSEEYTKICQVILKEEWDVLKGDLRKLDRIGVNA